MGDLMPRTLDYYIYWEEFDKAGDRLREALIHYYSVVSDVLDRERRVRLYVPPPRVVLFVGPPPETEVKISESITLVKITPMWYNTATREVVVNHLTQPRWGSEWTNMALLHEYCHHMQVSYMGVEDFRREYAKYAHLSHDKRPFQVEANRFAEENAELTLPIYRDIVEDVWNKYKEAYDRWKEVEKDP